MQRLSYPTKTVLSNKITRNIIVLSFKDSPRKPLGRRRPMPPKHDVGSFDGAQFPARFISTQLWRVGKSNVKVFSASHTDREGERERERERYQYFVDEAGYCVPRLRAGIRSEIRMLFVKLEIGEMNIQLYKYFCPTISGAPMF